MVGFFFLFLIPHVWLAGWDIFCGVTNINMQYFKEAARFMENEDAAHCAPSPPSQVNPAMFVNG